ncbi:MAG: YraN family protein [Bryobacteraceae bacterium]
MAASSVEVIFQFSDWLRHIARRRRWTPTLALGRRGEDLAHRYLRAHGFVIVARNYRLSSGDAEADLIAWEGETLVFVEVKSRTTADFGPPERAIGEEKRRHLLRIAREYTRKTETPWDRIRLDVVSVVLTKPPDIQLFRNALSTKSRA